MAGAEEEEEIMVKLCSITMRGNVILDSRPAMT
jgi:hypothetical protein